VEARGARSRAPAASGARGRAPFQPMIVGISVFELHLPASRSLKDKRRVVKSLIERVHQRYRVSIAETDFHDLHQRAEIAMAAVVAGGENEMEKLMDQVRDILESDPEVYLTRWDPQLLEGLEGAEP
jgi:uncharacterized protein YlxP (DUF503 family)